MPSHGMMMMINDTVYNITGLNYNTNYIITVYASNDIGKGEQTNITVKLKSLPPGKVLKCNTHVCIYACMYDCIQLLRLKLCMIYMYVCD